MMKVSLKHIIDAVEKLKVERNEYQVAIDELSDNFTGVTAALETIRRAEEMVGIAIKRLEELEVEFECDRSIVERVNCIKHTAPKKIVIITPEPTI